MKALLRTSVLIIILFAAITILTAKIERPFDGINAYGFPLAFYTEFSLETYFPMPPEFNFRNLLIDLALAIVLGIVIHGFTNYLRSGQKCE